MTVQKAQVLIATIEQGSEKFTTTFEKTKIQWRRIGSGKPLVLIHGGSGGWLHWVHNIEALASHYTLWLPDLPGCGESQDLAAPINVPRLAQALSQSIDSLIGVDAEVGIAGFSFGSYISTTVGAADPRIGALIAIAPPVDRYEFASVKMSEKAKFIVHGEEDELISIKTVRQFYAALPEPKELVIIDRANHLFDGQASEVGDALEELLEDYTCRTQ